VVRYSEERKAAVLGKLMPPHNRSVEDVAPAWRLRPSIDGERQVPDRFGRRLHLDLNVVPEPV
jgi:hypothetical protein